MTALGIEVMPHREGTEAGFVYRAPKDVEEAVAGPRCAVFADGGLVCSFVRQSKLGTNDFRPHLAWSEDNGKSWTTPHAIWPHLADQWSIYGQVSIIPETDMVLFYGTRCPIDQSGESFWRDDIYGMKQNNLVWARSDDRGRTWSEPREIPMPHAGSAEAPGPILVTEEGNWLACYSPYRNWDPAAEVDCNCLRLLRSSDEGQSWVFSRIMTFAEGNTCAAEAWLAELSPGHIVASCWHNTLSAGADDLSNKIAFSQDSGNSWNGPIDTGILGQSTALLALEPGKALMLYNKRKHGPPGIGCSVLTETGAKVGISGQQMLWLAARATEGNSSGSLAEWTDFSFGGPALNRLRDGRFILVFWQNCEGRAGISMRVFNLDA